MASGCINPLRCPRARAPSPPTRNRLTGPRFLLVTLLALLAPLAWDAGGLDLPLARVFGSASGFALQHSRWLEQLLHDDVQALARAVAVLLLVLAVWPLGPLRRLALRERLGLASGIVLAALAVAVVKHFSTTSCPWELQPFGGVARYVSHWRWGVPDGGSGHCFPAGHASTGFAFVAAWFWLQARMPRAARACLLASLALGLGLGLVQVARGAHYFSHVLWAGWLCWITGGLWWLALRRVSVRGSRWHT